jgi:mannose-6-phosphate isomerase-like protein (cupin superfamily)
MGIRNLDEVVAFVTKDGSEIRELLAPRNSCITNQTLAEARLGPGSSTTPHYHIRSEEIYYIVEGEAEMLVGGERNRVRPNDAIGIPPRQLHQITDTGSGVLRFLCCCSPGYDDGDTILIKR